MVLQVNEFKMPGKKKKFIDKRKAVSFSLVHRSQRDPLQADPDASQHVLLEVPDLICKKKKYLEKCQEQVAVESLLSIGQSSTAKPCDLHAGPTAPPPSDDGSVLSLEFDDSCEVPDELSIIQKHPVKRNSTIAQEINFSIPESAFASKQEEKVGLLNKAVRLTGPQLDWDPDIVAAMDEDFDFDNPDNFLEDDFIEKANNENYTIDEDDPSSVPCNHSDNYPSDEADDDFDENCSDAGSLGEQSFMSTETKTRFTNYSMSSSVMKRTDGLTLLDDRFEKFYEGYDDDEIGALDHEEIEGYVHENSTILNDVLEEFEENQRQIKLKDAIAKGINVDVHSDSSSSDNELLEVEPPKQDFDCESIISTYSTIYNHPTLILERNNEHLKLTKRAAIPANILPDKASSSKKMAKVNHRALKGDIANTYRPKNETLDEKKQRKQAIKEERKARRKEKKNNKLVFKAEEMKQNQNLINLKKNFQMMTIL